MQILHEKVYNSEDALSVAFLTERIEAALSFKDCLTHRGKLKALLPPQS